MKTSQLRQRIRGLAMHGYIDLEAIKSVPDVDVARKFSAPFRNETEGHDIVDVFGDVIEERALGIRHYHTEMDLWLTEAEWPK